MGERETRPPSPQRSKKQTKRDPPPHAHTTHTPLSKNQKQQQAPWCGHCQQLAEKYAKAAASLSGVVRVLAVNCDAAGGVCSSRGVRGYPTLKAWIPASSSSSTSSTGRWVDYNGERTAAALSKWAASLVPSRSEALHDRGDLDALLARCGGPKAVGAGGRRGVGASAASSGLCLVLVTPKPETPSLWKALSLAYDGAVAFGTARRKDGGRQQQQQQQGGYDTASLVLEAARRHNATAAAEADAAAAKSGGAGDARVVAVCNGDLSGAEIYTGRLKSDALRRLLRAHADGKRCRSRLRLDGSTDLSKMGVAQLKAVAEARGVTCDGGCLEKADYIRALKASLLAGAEAAAGGHEREEL